MKATVVVPCLNEENYLGSLLEDLAAQTIPTPGIVADCHSTDKTVQVAKSFKKHMSVEITFAPHKSAGSARNAGAKLAKTEYVLFLDADMRIPADFIEKLTSRAKSKGKDIDIVSPRFKSEGFHPFDFLNVLIINLWILRTMKISRKPIGASGALLVKKQKHDLVGGFDDKIREFDDIVYAKKLQKAKCSFGFAWNAVAVLSNRRAVAQGRFKSAVQQLPDHYFLVRKVVRPLMKKFGISKKWGD